MTATLTAPWQSTVECEAQTEPGARAVADRNWFIGEAAKGSATKLHNYVTCVNLQALVAANRPSYTKVIKDATAFLQGLQWDEAEGKTKDNDFYGGAGYDSKSRPDLSNTQIFLDALKAVLAAR